jgi:hypothetical protein
MPTLLFETGRQHTVVRFVASHQQLLFRSNKGEGGATRAEVLFRGVQYMSVKSTIYDVFNIYEIALGERPQYLGLFYADPPASCKVFGIGGPSVGGVVVAAGYFCSEDDDEFWEPSNILQFDE